MAVRINQEDLQVLTSGVANSGNCDLNQLCLLVLSPIVLTGTKVQLVGGPFQDALGNPLSNGYLLFQLQHDTAIPGAVQILGNISVPVPLDINGYVSGTVTGPAVYIWPNDLMTPAGVTYLIWAYDSSNRLVWDNPQVQQVLSTPSPFNLNAWTPGP